MTRLLVFARNPDAGSQSCSRLFLLDNFTNHYLYCQNSFSQEFLQPSPLGTSHFLSWIDTHIPRCKTESQLLACFSIPNLLKACKYTPHLSLWMHSAWSAWRHRHTQKQVISVQSCPHAPLLFRLSDCSSYTSTVRRGGSKWAWWGLLPWGKVTVSTPQAWGRWNIRAVGDLCC